MLWASKIHVCRFAFLRLAVMTQSYTLCRDDATFLPEHCGSRGEPKMEKFTERL